MPFPSEHSARFLPPRQFKKFRRDHDKLGDGVDVIYGFRPDGNTEIQSVRFKSDRWSYRQAADWLKEHRTEMGKPMAFERASDAAPEPEAAVASEPLPPAAPAPDAPEEVNAVTPPDELHAGFRKIVRWLNTPWQQD